MCETVYEYTNKKGLVYGYVVKEEDEEGDFYIATVVDMECYEDSGLLDHYLDLSCNEESGVDMDSWEYDDCFPTKETAIEAINLYFRPYSDLLIDF